MGLLSNAAFLEELANLYAATKTSGSVWITMKRYEDKPRGKKDTTNKKQGSSAGGGATSEGENLCLIRATDGKHKKISTLLRAKDLVHFQMSLAAANKKGMDGLKKRDRRRRGKKKAQYV
ncbi:RNA-binding signal recognition particle subunit srp14 [Balamuthia mandrillaris]